VLGMAKTFARQAMHREVCKRRNLIVQGFSFAATPFWNQIIPPPARTGSPRSLPTPGGPRAPSCRHVVDAAAHVLPQLSAAHAAARAGAAAAAAGERLGARGGLPHGAPHQQGATPCQWHRSWCSKLGGAAARPSTECGRQRHRGGGGGSCAPAAAGAPRTSPDRAKRHGGALNKPAHPFSLRQNGSWRSRRCCGQCMASKLSA
jgi:hypothetical protein